MSSKVLIDTQSPFRKSHTVSRSSGSKTQRDASSSNQGNSVNFFGHNAQQVSNGSNSNEVANVNQTSYVQTQQQPHAGTLYLQQLRGTRNNSENRHSTTSTNGSLVNNNSSSAAVNTSQTNIKTSQILRNNSNFSATPQKKKEQISMYVIESGGSKISHSTSLNQNFSQMSYQNLKQTGTSQNSNGMSTGASSGIKQQPSSSLSNSSQKFLNQNSIFTNNFAKENVGFSMHKHNMSSGLVSQSKIPSGNGAISSCAQQSSSINSNSINNNTNNNNSSMNTNLTNSGNNQNVFYQMQNQSNNSNINNNSASLSPNQKTLYQNILNSSWKVNMLPNQTPRKTGDSCSTNNNNSTLIGNGNPANNCSQNSTSNSTSKLLASSSRSYSKSSARQQPYIQDNNYQLTMNTSGKASGQNMSPFNQSNTQTNVNQRLNTSSSSSSKGQSNEEIKRLKIEIEQFKNREIKYLVRIATLEKETKKLSESLEKSETMNRDISLENSKIRRMNSFNNTSVNMSYTGNSADKNLIINNMVNNCNVTSSIDELQRSIRQKTEPQDSTPQQNSNTQSNPPNSGLCCQCGLNNSQNSYGVNSGNKQGGQAITPQSSSASYNKYKLKYTQLRHQHKDILKQCIDLEKDNKEIKSESQVMRQLYLETVCSKTAQQQSDNNQSNGTSTYNVQSNFSNQVTLCGQQSTLDSIIQEKIPSFLKVLSIGQNTCN